MEKSYVGPRILAYFVDMIIISIVIGLIGMVLPNQDNIEKLNTEYNGVMEKYVEGEIEEEEFINRYSSIQYDIDYQSVPSTIVSTVVIISYFIVFQFLNKGQTLGKKLMKIKVVSNSDEEELTINQLLYRSLLANYVLIDVLNLILILFMNKNYYFYATIALQMVQIVLILITIFMVLFKKDGRGLHDKLGNTKVVMAD